MVLAGLWNALEIVGKRLDDLDITMIGVGAANMAVYRLLRAAGIDPTRVIACDSRGILHRGRGDIEERCDGFPDKWRVCQETNPHQVTGGVAEAMVDADVCIAFSSPGPETIRPEWVSTMADDAIVFACANPVPEIWPWEATAAGARVVATGRSDLPNQVNNSLGFPGIFRGVLDVQASAITDEMALPPPRCSLGSPANAVSSTDSCRRCRSGRSSPRLRWPRPWQRSGRVSPQSLDRPKTCWLPHDTRSARRAERPKHSWTTS